MSTIAELCRHGRQGAACLLAPGEPPTRYESLWHTIERVGRALRGLGIAPADRVALVLDNGPAAAAAFLAVASHAACAPLNPGYRVDELVFYLLDLKAKLVVTTPDARDAHEAAARCGIAVVHVQRGPAATSGELAIVSTAGVPCDGPPPSTAAPDDIALLLHTSGTTARPKLVPLTHRKLVASARSIARWLALSPEDRALGVMPLFHIHGLVGVLLASIAAGSSVCCTPGMDAASFPAWLTESAATWYSAVPTMHQALLARARQQRWESLPGCLRFVRSSSAALPPAVLEALEALTGVPVVEAYGMTEACHQITSNPLPPGLRRPGTVGPTTGTELAILDEHGHPRSPGAVGEVALRGPTIIERYEAEPAVNEAAFAHGYFRTGDLGRIDEHGCLVLVGRIKEMINRGGEKIAPGEVDDVLLRHPAVRQAFAFAVPDARLGEVVAAAVVPAHEGAVSEDELRRHAARYLADFKVPTAIRIVDEIPRGPTGKVQRRRLPELLGFGEHAAASPASPPSAGSVDPARLAVVLDICREVLQVAQLEPDADLLAAGADSLALTRIQARLRKRLGAAPPMYAIYSQPRPLALAASIAPEPEPDLGDRLDGPSDDARDAWPLSPMQQALWLEQQLHPRAAHYWRPCVFRLDVAVEVERAVRALQRLHARHPCLRSRFLRAGSRLEQRFDVPWPGCAVHHDVDAGSLDERLLALAAPFALEHGACHYHLLCGSGTCWLVIHAHHIVLDGGSEAVLARDLAACLRDDETVAPEPPRFGRHAAALARAASSERARESVVRWVEAVRDVDPVLDLDLPRPAAPPPLRGARLALVLDAPLTRALAELAASLAVTPFAVLLAAYEAILLRHARQTRFCIAVPVAGRDEPELHDVVGMLAGLLVLPAGHAGAETLSQRARSLLATFARALDRGVVPLSGLVAALRPVREPGRPPLAQVSFTVQAPRVAVVVSPGLTLTPCPTPARDPKLELSLDLTPVEGRWEGFLEYDAERFERGAIERLAAELLEVLHAAVGAPHA